MKKIIKTACLALSIILVCLTFCSCNALDEMKESQAFYVGDDIVFQGETYKKLPLLDDNCSLVSTHDIEGYVTKEDVPVLLSTIMGSSFTYSSNGIIWAAEFDGYYTYDYNYFCREDLYDYLCEVISKNEFDNLCVSYYDWENAKYVNQLLDEDLTRIFKKALETGFAGSYDDYFNDYSNPFYYEVYISFCDAKMLLTSNSLDLAYDYNTESYILVDENVYAIPAEYNETVTKLIESVTEDTVTFE